MKVGTRNGTALSIAHSVKKTLAAATKNISTRSPQTFTDLDAKIFTSSSVPVWRLASLEAMGRGQNAISGKYSEVIAVDLAYAWLKEMLKTVESALSAKTQAADAVEAATQLRARIAEVRQLAATEYMAQYLEAKSLIEMQRSAQWLHETMMRSMPMSLERSISIFRR
jgi:hypothetical protein